MQLRIQTRKGCLKCLLDGLDWQDHRKGAALPRRASQCDRASQQHRHLPDDGKTQSRATDFARVAPFHLVKGFKDALLHLRRDTHSGILHSQGQMFGIHTGS